MSTVPSPRRRREQKNMDEENRFGFRFMPSLSKRLRAAAVETGDDMTAITETALDLYLSGQLSAQQEPVAPDPAYSQIRLPLIGRIPCGPLRAALDETTSSVTITHATAKTYRLVGEHFAAVAEGESMMGKAMDRTGDLREDDVVIFEQVENLVRPKDGSIVAIQIETSEGVEEGTIKLWKGGAIVDGNGDPYAPAEGKDVRFIGVARMLMRGL